MDQEKDWGESGVFLCLLGLGVLFAQGQADGLHLAFPGHGDGKGITGGMLLDQGAKVVLLGDLSASMLTMRSPVFRPALSAGPPCTTSTT